MMTDAELRAWYVDHAVPERLPVVLTVLDDPTHPLRPALVERAENEARSS